MPADTSGPPPAEAEYYIAEAKKAVADQNWTAAVFISTRGAAWYPQNAEILCLQGYSYRKMGEYQRSVDIISRAIPLDPKAVRYANRGYGYLALKNYSAALADAEAGIALDAGYTTNYGVKALALQGMGRNAEAQEAISTALAQAPDSAHYWHIKGKILAAAGDCSGAQAAFEKSLALDPVYVLPYPGFGNARGSLDTLGAACSPLPAQTGSTKASLGCASAIATALAVVALGMRR
jgi:tetratricopeptide (TPR) repeat protein